MILINYDELENNKKGRRREADEEKDNKEAKPLS